MHWLAPANLLWLLPLAGGIVALWMLKAKRTDHLVSSLFLWRALTEDAQVNSPLQRLRRNPLLFLQLLAVLLLVLALARPFAWGQARRARAVVFVVDTSASMSARDGDTSRLDAAKDAVQKQLRTFGDGDMAALVAAGVRPVTLSGWTANKSHLSDALDSVHSTDAPGDLASAVKLAQSLAGSRAGAEVRVVTDGVLTLADRTALESLPASAASVSQAKVGMSDAANIALVALGSRRDTQTGSVSVLVKVQSFGDDGRGGTLSLLQNGKLLDARELSFGPDGNQTETFEGDSLAHGGTVTARLDDVHDALDADNVASLVLAPVRPRRILLVSRGNLFLERGLAVDPTATLEECAPADWAGVGKSGAGYDLTVFDGFLPPGGPPVHGGFLVVGAFGPSMPITQAETAFANPLVVSQDGAHPLLRFADMSNLKLRAAPRTTLAPGAISLVQGTAGPLLAVSDTGARRIAQVSFALSDSDWPVRVSFPIFLLNACDWLSAAGQAGTTQEQFTAGMAASVNVGDAQGASVVHPDGTTVPVPVVHGLAQLGDTTQTGVFRVRAAGTDYPVAVNLLNADESNVAAQQLGTLHRAGTASASGAHIHRAPREWGLWAAALALCLLIAEWAWWNRRG